MNITNRTRVDHRRVIIGSDNFFYVKSLSEPVGPVWTPRKKCQWKFNEDGIIFIQEDYFVNAFGKMAVNLTPSIQLDTKIRSVSCQLFQKHFE